MRAAAIMAKSFKLRFSKVIPSFLLCRSKNPNRLHINPLPVSIYRLSPLNRKSLDIAYPSFPNPPPSTPISSYEKKMVSGMVDVGCKARDFNYECSVESPEWKWKRSLSGGESNDGDVSSTTSPLVPKKRVGKRKGASLNVMVKKPISSSSGDSGWFSSDEGETLETSSRNISNESSESLIATANIKRLKHQSSKIRSVRSKQKVTTSAEKASNFRSKTVMESIAVEKRSDDPYGDFKMSMMEMILEKEMFETRDLEDLLQCFLTLNSRHHHKVIVEAFTEIWDALFSISPLNRRLVTVKDG
ncbi:unnamed protein product [Rhodiola kirilowii]